MSKLGGVDHRVIGVVFGISVLGGLMAMGSPGGAARNGAISTVNVGFFANVTHAPALVAIAKGEFQRAVGKDVQVNPRQMSAGPEEMEALVAGDIDVAYVGPSPALNTFIKSQGKALRIISGVCEGGASLVAASGSHISSISDLAGKRIAVPQLGNTQDVSLRHFIKGAGLAPKDQGGDVDVIPAQNADTLNLFRQRAIDAAWVPEPWATRLVAETGATRVVDERSLWPGGRFASTVLVVRSAYAEVHPEVVAALIQANDVSVKWLQKDPTEAHNLVNRELYELAGKHKAKQVPDAAWAYLDFTTSVDIGQIEASARYANECGFLKSVPQNLAAIYDPRCVAGKGTKPAE